MCVCKWFAPQFIVFFWRRSLLLDCNDQMRNKFRFNVIQRSTDARNARVSLLNSELMWARCSHMFFCWIESIWSDRFSPADYAIIPETKLSKYACNEVMSPINSPHSADALMISHRWEYGRLDANTHTHSSRESSILRNSCSRLLCARIRYKMRP